MAEAIDLPPLHVQAIRVPVQPPPNSIVGPAEVFLQLGENGGVQIDTFWRDAMGNEIHESTEMQEEEYEALRARYMRTEQATLPPFSSFKSGNTIGRVVGETAPAAVSASQANPPIEAETEKEGITGEQVLDGIQLGLDVFGLIPVVGEAADIANAVVSLARGDYVGAGLSLLSAIPFVGYAGTAGKAARYGTTMVETSGKAVRGRTGGAANEATQNAAQAVEKKASEELARKQASGASIKGKKPSKKDIKRAQLKRNQKNGKLREQEVEKELEAEGHEILGTQVSVKTQESRRVIDILIKDGKTGKTRAIEVKSGGATRSAIQIKKDNSMAEKGGTFIGKNAPKSDAYKETMKIDTEVIN